MAKCSNCGAKIEYNQFHWYRGKVLCYKCYDTRLERKKAKKAEKEMMEKAIDPNASIEEELVKESLKIIEQEKKEKSND